MKFLKEDSFYRVINELGHDGYTIFSRSFLKKKLIVIMRNRRSETKELVLYSDPDLFEQDAEHEPGDKPIPGYRKSSYFKPIVVPNIYKKEDK